MEIPGERELSFRGLEMTRNGLFGSSSTGYRGLFAVLLALLSSSVARADQILIANQNANTVAAYTTSGATVNAALISGLNNPQGIAVDGSFLFVTNFGPIKGGAGSIGEYILGPIGKIGTPKNGDPRLLPNPRMEIRGDRSQER